MPKKGKFTTCHVNVCSRNLDMDQGRYQQTNNSRDGILRSVEGKSKWERIKKKVKLSRYTPWRHVGEEEV
jgi:hypothetical protein